MAHKSLWHLLKKQIKLMNNNTAVTITYSDSKLRVLVEEYITMQKHEFIFGGLCSYVLYWAKEECKTANTGLYESNNLASADSERLRQILAKIMREGRITVAVDDNTRYLKTKE